MVLRRRRWHPIPVLLPGKSHGQRSLVGCGPWGREESDTTERLHFHFSLSCIGEGNGNPHQCSCLEDPRDRGAWWAAVYGVVQSRTRLRWLSSSIPLYSFISSVCVCVYSVAQSCPTLCDPMYCSPPASSVHQVFQARILERVTISYSRGFSWPKDWTHVSCVSCIGRQNLYCWTMWEAQPLYMHPWTQSTAFFLLNILNIGYTCRFLFIQCLYSITVISLCDAQIVPKLDGGNPFIVVPLFLSHNPVNL